MTLSIQYSFCLGLYVVMGHKPTKSVSTGKEENLKRVWRWGNGISEMCVSGSRRLDAWDGLGGGRGEEN